VKPEPVKVKVSLTGTAVRLTAEMLVAECAEMQDAAKKMAIRKRACRFFMASKMV